MLLKHHYQHHNTRVPQVTFPANRPHRPVSAPPKRSPRAETGQPVRTQYGVRGRRLARRAAALCSADDGGDTRVYTVAGQVFFASSDAFVDRFDFKEVIKRVRIDVRQAHFWDITAVGALDKVVLKFRREGTEVEVVGLNEASATMVDKFGVHDKDGADDLLMGH